MHYFLNSEDPIISTRVRAGLAVHGLELKRTRVLEEGDARLEKEFADLCSESTVFFGCNQLGIEEQAKLRHLCGLAAGAKVVAIIRGVADGRALQAIRSGAFDCLNVETDFDDDLAQLLQRIEAQQSNRNGQLISIVSASGGSGASTLAVNLATVLARRQGSCCLLDFHLRGGDATTLLNCEPKHNLLSLSEKADQLDKTMLEQSLQRLESGVNLLASPEPFHSSPRVRPELIQKVVHFARALHPTTIIDFGVEEDLDRAQLLMASDHILITLRPDFPSVFRVKALLNDLAMKTTSREGYSLVITGYDQPRAIAKRQIEETLGHKVAFEIPFDPAICNEAANLGVPWANSSHRLSNALSTMAAQLVIGHSATPASFTAKRRPDERWFLPLISAASLLATVRS